MPRLKVIVLDQDPNNSNSYNILLWADIPPARQKYYASNNNVSLWRDAQTTDNDALKAGEVVEQGSVLNFPKGTTMAQVQAYLQVEWQKYQDAINAANPWLHYGSTWDGTIWNVTTGQ